MKNLTDTEYLLEQQYLDPSNLEARVALHRRFSMNPLGSQPCWFAQQLDLAEGARVLEVGCGPGGFWTEIDDLVPPSWEIVVSDFSPGMVAEAKRRLAALERPIAVIQADVQELAFPHESFDGVIANFMLYHVPDRPKALGEIHRILKPGGRIYAMTNGVSHMREFHELVNRVVPGTARDEESGFSLENAPAQLERWFRQIEVRRYRDSLRITEVEPMLAYIRSWLTWISPEDEEALRRKLEQQIAREGELRVTKDPGLITARRV